MKRFLKIVGVAAGLFFLTAGAAYGQEDCSKLSFMDDVSRKPRTDLPFQISEMRRLRPEDICKKKEGWFPTGLPLLNSDPNVGVGYGVRVFLINNGKKTDPFFEYTPYRFRMFAQYFNTTKNRQYQDISFDAPYIFDTKSPSQNLKKNISQRSGKFLKNVRVPTETVVLKVFSRRLRL